MEKSILRYNNPMTQKLSYSQLSTKLDQALEALQQEDIELDEALKSYKEAIGLVEQLEKELKTAQNTVKKVKIDLGKQTSK